MPDGVQDQLPERHQARLAVDRRAGPRPVVEQPQDAGHLPAGEGDQLDLLLDIPVVVTERAGVAGALGTEQERPVRGDRPLHPVGEELLAVGQVADDLQGAPAALNGPGSELLGGQARHGVPELPRAGLVGGDQVVGRERPVVPLGGGDRVGAELRRDRPGSWLVLRGWAVGMRNSGHARSRLEPTPQPSLTRTSRRGGGRGPGRGRRSGPTWLLHVGGADEEQPEAVPHRLAAVAHRRRQARLALRAESSAPPSRSCPGTPAAARRRAGRTGR